MQACGPQADCQPVVSESETLRLLSESAGLSAFIDYEREEMPHSEQIFELAKKAHKNFLEKKILNKIKYDEDIYIKFNSHSVKINNKNYIDLIKSDKIDEKSKYIIFELDAKLLKWLLNGPKYAHWNNAEIGSHIKYFRKPNTYSRNLHANMCYFHI